MLRSVVVQASMAKQVIAAICFGVGRKINNSSSPGSPGSIFINRAVARLVV